MSYKDLKSYQNATIIYDFTMEFCKRYVRMGSRTRDQMEQAGRSGKQNIVEGSATESLSSAIKLTMVARASLEELLFLIITRLSRCSRNILLLRQKVKKNKKYATVKSPKIQRFQNLLN